MEDPIDDFTDSDTCSIEELNKLFDHSLRLSHEKAISLQNDYILFLDGSCDFTKIAAATSNKVHCFNLDKSKGFTQIGEKCFEPFNSTASICGIKFWNENPNNVTIAQENGKIFTYDLRTKNSKPINQIPSENESYKEFLCFDMSADDKFFCVGCQRNQVGETPILFYDIRNEKMQLSYVDSHQDDVTYVKFHPTKFNLIATGSTDGLINIFNMNEKTEDDAMISCFNTESSVQLINWHPKKNDDFYLSCITHTNDLCLFDTETEDLIGRRERNEITDAIKRRSVFDCYLIDCYTDLNEKILLLAGSNFNNGECLRSLNVTENQLIQRHNFVNNKQIVRCSCFDPKENVLITGGEGGIISIWDSKASGTASVIEKTNLKEHRKKGRKSKPY